MTVQTLQGYDLRNLSGPIDLDRGQYKDNPKISSAQRRLYERLKENQLVWCDQEEPILHEQLGRYLHDIDVDSRDIVAVVDSFVWCHIIGYDPRYILEEDHCRLRNMAATSGKERDVELRRLEDQFLADNLPSDLWSAVAKAAVSKKSDQLLLKFPFAFSTIVSVECVTEAMAKRGRRKTNAR